MVSIVIFSHLTTSPFYRRGGPCARPGRHKGGPYGRAEARLRLLERLLEVLGDVLDILEPDRDADEAVVDAELGALRRADLRMRRRRRVGDEALRVAEVVGDVDE